MSREIYDRSGPHGWDEGSLGLELDNCSKKIDWGQRGQRNTSRDGLQRSQCSTRREWWAGSNSIRIKHHDYLQLGLFL